VKTGTKEVVVEQDPIKELFELGSKEREAAGEYFGADRICFGTDWPVCLLAGAYAQVYEVMDKFSQQLNKEEKEKLMGLNTMQFYGI
jgi:L-fuconolactonase